MTSRVLWLSLAVLAAGCKSKSDPAAPPAAAGAKASAIAGTWERTLVTNDENANDKLDDAERKPLGLKIGYTRLDIRADGTCELENAKGHKGKGTCALVDSEGQAFLEIVPSLADAAELDEWHHRVLRRSDKELIVKDPTGPQGAIYLFERK